MRVASWKAWYTNGRVFCSSDTTWAELPDDGVVYIKLFYDLLKPDGDPTGQNCSGSDFYFHVPGTPETEIYGHSDGPLVEILTRYPGALVKRGKWTSVYELHKVTHEANKKRAEQTPCCGK